MNLLWLLRGLAKSVRGWQKNRARFAGFDVLTNLANPLLLSCVSNHYWLILSWCVSLAFQSQQDNNWPRTVTCTLNTAKQRIRFWSGPPDFSSNRTLLREEASLLALPGAAVAELVWKRSASCSSTPSLRLRRRPGQETLAWRRLRLRTLPASTLKQMS